MVKRITAPGGSSGELPPAADLAPDTGPQGLAELAQLAAAAERVESGQAADAPPAAPPAEAAPLDYRGACREVVEVAAALVLPLVAWRFGPAVADLYGPRELAKIGDALGAVAEKRGWNLDDLMAGYGPELALCAALAGPVLPLMVARAKAARQAAEVAEAAPAAPRPTPAPAPDLEPPPPPPTPHDGSARPPAD